MFYFYRLIILIFVLVSLNAFALDSKSVEYHGYMRAGHGTNSKGGDQVCFRNGGTSGTEFRLGNECEHFGEVAFNFNHLKDNKSGKFFRTQLRFAYSANGHTNWEAPGIAVREIYAEGGKFSELPLTYWAGKRFYRENDVWMNDFYYFADTSGVGAGVGNIPIKIGKLHLAHLKETSSTTSSIGSHAVTLWDARIKDIKLCDKLNLMAWIGYATAPEGKEHTGTKKDYDSSKGTVFGLLFARNFDKGFNHFAILRGSGLLDEFSLYGTAALERNSAGHKAQKKSKRWRFVEHLTLKPIDSMEFHFASTLELRDSGAVTANKEHWYNFGVQPVYFFTDHYQLAFLAGYSVVDADQAKKRTLARFTISPQVSISKGIWGRPVLRAFYTRSFWNYANKGTTTGGSIDSSGPYQNENSGASWGFQGEIWF